MQQTRAAPPATLEAVLERITYANQETGYTVAWVATGRSSDLLTVVGLLLGAQPVESLRLRPRQLPGWPRRRGPAGRQGQPADSARPAGRAAVAADPGDGPHPRPWPRPHRGPNPEGRRRRRPVLPPRRQSHPGHPPRPWPGSRRWRTVTVHAVTSLTLGSVSPAQLAGWLRGYWRIGKPAALPSAT